ncbi:ISAs1 family transposase [Aeromonas veronii]
MALKSLLDYLESIPDPRNQAKCSHILSEVVFMAICAMMCGFDTWSEITLFAQEREPWFRRWLSLPGGIPSHDTFNRIFATLPPASLKSIFQAWIGDIMGDDKLVGQLAVDGKALRATAKGRGANAVHMVNVWSTELGMCVGQQKVADKSNEITAIPELLQLLELKGCLVSIDAMGTQVKIADTILKKSGDYLLAVKDNQPSLGALLIPVFRHSGQPAHLRLPVVRVCAHHRHCAPPTILCSNPSLCCSSARMSARISASVRSGAGL